MTDTATPETGPVDAPASFDSIAAEIAAGGDTPADALDEVTQELVKEAEGNGEPDEGPETEDDATDPGEVEPQPPEGNPEGTDDDPFAKLLAANPDLTVKVKVNGEVIEVPLSELPNGYSRTEDYKAKTASVAEERRQIEAQRANIDADLKAQYANQLEEATNLFAQYDPILAEARTINWEALKAQDPAAFVAAQDTVQARLSAIREMQSKVAQARQEAEQHQQSQLQSERAERFDNAANEIVKTHPELADEGKFKEFAEANISTLRDIGFTNEEIVDALDHRVLTLADKARRWDAHVAATKSLPEKKVVPKSAVKPLTTDGTGSAKPRSRFPGNASRQAQGEWIANQILSEE